MKYRGFATFRHRLDSREWGNRRILVVLECDDITYAKPLSIRCTLGRADVTLIDGGFFSGDFVLSGGRVLPFTGRVTQQDQTLHLSFCLPTTGPDTPDKREPHLAMGSLTAAPLFPALSRSA